MKLILDSHQVDTVKYMIDNPYSIVALDMGLGKTACALDVWEKVGRPKLVVVCPAYLVFNWRDEIEKCFGPKVIVSMFLKGNMIYEVFDSDIVVLSYNMAQKAEQIFEWADMVALDEGQELKTMETQRTEFIHRVVYENSIRRLHILTGTPIKNRVEEYYSLIALCNYDPRIKKSDFLDRFPDRVAFADYFSHRKEFSMEINGARGLQWVRIVRWEGVRRVPELKKYLRGHYIRFAYDKVFTLRDLMTKDILISQTNDKKLLQAFEAHYSQDGSDSVASTYKAEAALKKVPFTVNYVKNILDQVGCIPIYSDHVEATKAIAQAFDVPAITGEMPAEKRAALGKRFQRGEIKVLAATVKSFSTGVSLTAANNLALNDFPWVPGDISQVIHRIRRRDQTKPCTIHRILGSPQDKKILEMVEEKAETIGKVV